MNKIFRQSEGFLSSMIFYDDLLIKITLIAKIDYVLRKQNGLTWLFLLG